MQHRSYQCADHIHTPGEPGGDAAGGHRIGNRRRIRFQDLIEYRKRDYERRQKTAEELTREAEELGFYDE